MYVVTLVRSAMMHEIRSKHNKLRISQYRDERYANALQGINGVGVNIG